MARWWTRFWRDFPSWPRWPSRTACCGPGLCIASIGHPCLGDPLYGGKSAGTGFFHRQALHALALSLAHPRSGERLEFVAPLPTDFVEFLATKLHAADGRELR